MFVGAALIAKSSSSDRQQDKAHWQSVGRVFEYTQQGVTFNPNVLNL